ncbi:EAL domain-containing protein [Roseibium algae]|uniref:EAL domain-containing protein n=1 Tax=Roseibium algae TaxID=3123038 RepID=A0ABU8THB2_9HYPH
MADKNQNDAGRAFTTRLNDIIHDLAPNGSKPFTYLKITFIFFLAFTLITLTGGNLIGEFGILTKHVDTTTKTAKSFLLHEQEISSTELDKTLLSLAVNQELSSALKANDRYSVEQIISRLFPELENLHNISELAIYDTTRNLIIRSGKASSSADRRYNSLPLKSAETNSTTLKGFELEDNGTLVMSVIKPWILEGKPLGFLKLTMNFEEPLQFIGTMLKADVVEVRSRDALFSDTATAEAKHGWNLTPTAAYKKVGNFPLPTNVTALFQKHITPSSQFDRIVFNRDSVSIASSLPLPMADGTQAASLVLIQDITPEIRAFASRTAVTLLLACLVTLIIGLVLNRIVRSLQFSVIETRQSLEEEVAANTKALRNMQELWVEAQEIAFLGSWERDLLTNELSWSSGMYGITGLPQTTPIQTARDEYFKLIPPSDLNTVRLQMEQAISQCSAFNYEHHLVRKDGQTRLLHIRGYVIAGEDGKAIRTLGTVHDITDYHNAQERSQRLADILEASLNEIHAFDTETLNYEHANRCARENLGYSAEQMSGMQAWQVIGNNTAQQFKDKLRPLLNGSLSVLSFEDIHRRKDGSEYPAEIRVELHKTQSSSLFVAICNDLSERTAREKESQAARLAAEHMAYFDTLTELPNRAACQRDATDYFNANQNKKPAFIIHLDIDNFKRINDTLGHAAGDSALQEFGERLKLCCFGMGTAYRWGGDEFVIIANNSEIDPEELCQRVYIVMRAPMDYQNNPIWPSVSMGIAQCPTDGEDFNTLLVNADLALYRSKEDGKDRWSYFTKDMKTASDEEARTEQELRLALRRDEFFLVFQPQVNIQTQQITGIEALVRWQHPTRGVLAPGAFLPVVDKTNLATPLGQVVLDKALAAARKWHDLQLDFGRIAVNLSSSHLTSGTLLDDFNSLMAKHKVAPEYITAEVLESVFLDNERSNNSEVLEELHNLGVHIELDDFGTGYASLSHVADLPINGLKIDKSFTEQILSDRKKEIVVSHLINLARSLNINIVCEGVETEQQLDRLQMMGNFAVQGYLIARPMPFEAMSDWLTSTQSDLAFNLT